MLPVPLLDGSHINGFLVAIRGLESTAVELMSDVLPTLSLTCACASDCHRPPRTEIEESTENDHMCMMITGSQPLYP